jgi:hypothetical protein
MTQDRALYRVWIVEFSAWQPLAWHDVPPVARAVEPALPECLTAAGAAAYVAAFNRQMLADPRGQWAVPFPVAVRYDGEPAPGESLDLAAIDLAPLAAQAA